LKSWIGFDEPLHCVAVAQLEGSTKVARFELNLQGGWKKNPHATEEEGARLYMPVKYDCTIIDGTSYPSDFQRDVDCKVGQCTEYGPEFKVPSDCAWLGANPGITIGMVATWSGAWNTNNMMTKDNNWDSTLGYSVWDDNCQKYSVDLMNYLSACTDPKPQQENQMGKLVPVLIGLCCCCFCCCAIASQVAGGKGPGRVKRGLGLAKDDSDVEGTGSDYASESEAESSKGLTT